MHDSQHQSDALDQYFDALLRNPQAQSPAELDSELAMLAKALMETKVDEVADESVKNRVWSRVLFTTYAPPELEPSYDIAPNDAEAHDSSPVQLLPQVQHKRQRLDVTFLVAAVFAVVCLTGLFIQYTDTARDSLSRYQINQDERIITRTLPRERFMPSTQGTPALIAPPENRETASLFYYMVKHIPE